MVLLISSGRYHVGHREAVDMSFRAPPRENLVLARRRAKLVRTAITELYIPSEE